MHNTLNLDSLTTKLLRRAHRRLAVARWLLTPMIVAVWVVAAYALFLMVVVAWSFWQSLSGSNPGPIAGVAGAEKTPDRAVPRPTDQAGKRLTVPRTVREKGKTYKNEAADKKLGQYLKGRGIGVGEQDATVGERFTVALIESLGFGLMLLFLVAAVTFGLLATYLGFFFLPFLLTLPLSLGLSLFWVKPGQFLVLRPFRKREANVPLRRIIARNLAGLGHTYTLADAGIKVPLFIRIPILAGQLSFLAFHRRKIRKPSHIDSLLKSMQHRLRRNLNWCISPGRIFPVASNQNNWQECVRRMSAGVDGILFELSDIDRRENLLWELDLCAQSGLTDRVVFLIGAGGEAGAEEYLKSRGWPASVSDRLFVYDRSRLAAEQSFGAVVASLLARRVKAEREGGVIVATSGDYLPSDVPQVSDRPDGPSAP